MLKKTDLTQARPAGTRGQGVTRAEYNSARRLLNDNGRYALRWLPERVRQVMAALAQAPLDPLHEKAEFLARPDASSWKGCAWNRVPEMSEEYGRYCQRARLGFFAHCCAESLARINRERSAA